VSRSRSDAASVKKPRVPLPRGFGAIWSTVAIDLIGFGIVLPILPQYAEEFGATPLVIGLIVASFSVAQMVCAPLLGRLSDRIGRKPLLIISLFGTAAGSLLTGVAGSIWILFLGRIIDGASGASVSVAQAAVGDIAPPDQRPRLMGLLGAAFGVGFVAGPAIGALGALGGSHIPFFIAAVISSVNAVVAIRRLPETSPRRARAQVPGEDAERIADAPGLDGAGIVPPVHVAPPGGEVDRQRIRFGAPEVRDIVRLIGVAFLSIVAFAGFEATFSLLCQERFGFELAATGAVFTVIGLMLVFVQVGLIHAVSQKLGESGTLRFGLACNCLGLLTLAFEWAWVGLVLGLVLLCLGQGLITPTLASAVAGLAGRRRGEWLGWQQSAGGLARVVGPITAGALFQFAGVGFPYVIGAALAAFALTLVPTLA
jgi:DHA1 family tetracycline resistance protein-like MFS transporter